jgi:leader peptidase (prepilin peptidase)/N-methyltransferase
VKRAGILLSVLLCLVWIRPNALGMGDVKLLGVISLFGSWELISDMLSYALILAACTALVLVVRDRNNIKRKLPLVPFLLCGYILFFMKRTAEMLCGF